MLRTLCSPLLRVRPPTPSLTFRRCLAVASTETFSDPSTPLPSKSAAWASLLSNEPQKPNVLTDLPGPKVKAAKEAMGKIQDVCSTAIDMLIVGASRKHDGVRKRK